MKMSQSFCDDIWVKVFQAYQDMEDLPHSKIVICWGRVNRHKDNPFFFHN